MMGGCLRVGSSELSVAVHYLMVAISRIYPRMYSRRWHPWSAPVSSRTKINILAGKAVACDIHVHMSSPSV